MKSFLGKPQKSGEPVEPSQLEKRILVVYSEISKALEKQSYIDVTQDIDTVLQNVTGHLLMKKGKYRIRSNLVISESGLLEIEPGTELYFDNNTGLLAYGKLIAEGTPEEQIKFSPMYGAWMNVTLAGRFSEGSSLKYCKISNGTGRQTIPTSSSGHFREYSLTQVFGGGLLAFQSGFVLDHCIVEDNTAYSGGGVEVLFSEADIIECRISGNRGGGIVVEQSTCTLTDNQFEYNVIIDEDHLYGFGGGVYAWISQVSINHNIFIGNQASGGGGICAMDARGNISGNTIRDNFATGGGGMSIDDSRVIIEGNEIYCNQAHSGGGISIDAKIPIYVPILRGNNIYQNQATSTVRESVIDGQRSVEYAGGGLHCQYQLILVLEDNTIENNKPTDVYIGEPREI